MQVRLTATAIQAAAKRAAAAGGREELADTAQPGLRLRLAPSGRGTWVLGCRDRTGAARRFTLGAWPALGIAEAREAARALRAKVRGGADPLKERRAAAEAARAQKARDRLTLGTLVEDWQRERLAPHRSLRYSAEAVRALRVAFAAEWSRPAEGLDRATVRRVLDGIARKRPAEKGNATDRNAIAARTGAYGRACFGWAVKHEKVPANPFEALPDRPAAPSRERVLSDSELAEVWRAAEAAGGAFGRMVKLLILTGQRREEVAGVAWEELAPDLTLWTIPGRRTKNGAPQTVPLPPGARDVLAGLPRGTGLVFPSAQGTPFSAWSKAKARLDKAIADARGGDAEPMPPWTLHDLRRTLATGLQRLGVRLEVTEAVLNHVSGTRAGIVGVYQRHTWGPEKRAALDAWAAHLQAVLDGAEGAGGGKVVALRRTL